VKYLALAPVCSSRSLLSGGLTIASSPFFVLYSFDCKKTSTLCLSEIVSPPLPFARRFCPGF